MRLGPAGLALIALPALAGGRKGERAFLEHACTHGRDPAALRLPTGSVPRLPPGTAAQPLPDDVVVLVAGTDTLFVDGVPVRSSTPADAIAQARARSPRATWILGLDPSLPAARWTDLRDAVGPDAPILLAVEAPPPAGPPSPDASAVQRLVEGRAALRTQVEDPFSRLAALEELPQQVALPRGDCPTFRAVLRTPLGPDASCDTRIADALRALDACDLDRPDRARALAALGETWHPSDRAEVVLVTLPDDLPTDRTFGEAVHARAPTTPPR